MTRPDLRLDYCDHKAATYAVLNWHYSRRMPSGKLVHIGVWEGGKFIGAVIFGRGASDAIGRPYGLDQAEVCELVRVALTSHHAPVSRIMRIAIQLIRQTSPGLRLMVSYADPGQDHHGGIYQAGNWIYTGTTSPDTKYVDKTGKEWHSRTVAPSGYKKQFGVMKKVPKTGDMTAVKMPGKHKYLYALDDKMRQQVQALSRPYPKRTAGA